MEGCSYCSNDYSCIGLIKALYIKLLRMQRGNAETEIRWGFIYYFVHCIKLDTLRDLGFREANVR